jgi:hypothetical protein
MSATQNRNQKAEDLKEGAISIKTLANLIFLNNCKFTVRSEKINKQKMIPILQ